MDTLYRVVYLQSVIFSEFQVLFCDEEIYMDLLSLNPARSTSAEVSYIFLYYYSDSEQP